MCHYGSLSWIQVWANNPKHVYQFSTSYIKNIKMSTIRTCKIQTQVRDRGSPPLTLWRISTRIDPVRSLSAVTPTTSSLKNSGTHKFLTVSRKNHTRKHTSLLRPHLLQLFPLQVGILGDHFTWSPQTLFIETTTSTTPHNTRMKTCYHFSRSQK